MMTTRQVSVAPIRFPGWELRPAERGLLVNGEPVQVGGRAFELLLALVERRGRVVPKGELLDAAWKGLVVEENNISVQIATLRRVLGAKAIVTIAGRGYQLGAEALGDVETTPDMLPGATTTGVLPELLGRERDVAEIMKTLAGARLTTIVGTGGVGKTALAREAFSRQCALRQSGGCWIDLAPIREARQVVPLIAKSLGIEIKDAAKDAEGLAQALGQTRAFVAIDNCEHVVDEVARFVGIALGVASGIEWLATSREPLHVPGELTYRLEPLDVPAGPVSALEALEYGAIAMLCKRVAEADRRFALDEPDLPAAVALCQALDGLPLAIEMAAARVATFGLDEVCSRLRQRLKLLTAGPRAGDHRHQTLQATYDWSYELLTEAEQVVFRRLEPFLGGFRPDMAQQVVSDDAEGVVGDSWASLDALGSLVDKSLVQRTAGERGRFHLLESARDYARSRLDEAGETDAVRHRHACAVAAWFARAQADADRMTDSQWLRHYAPERHNAREALAWMREHPSPDELAQLVTALSMMDWFLCRQAEVLQLEVPLDHVARAKPALRAGAYLEFSWAHHCDGSHATGARLAQDAFEIFASLGESALAYRALAQLTRLQESRPGMADDAQRCWEKLQQFDDRQVPLRMRLFCAISAGLAKRPDFAIERLVELGRVAEGAGFDSLAAICGCNLTDKLLTSGLYAETVSAADRILRTAGPRPRAIGFILHNRTAALISMGRIDEARESARQALQAMPAVGRFLVDSFALAALRARRFADAAVLHGCATRLREELHDEPDPWEVGAIAETADGLATALNATELAELKRLGAAMSAGEVLKIKVFAPDLSA